MDVDQQSNKVQIWIGLYESLVINYNFYLLEFGSLG